MELEVDEVLVLVTPLGKTSTCETTQIAATNATAITAMTKSAGRSVLALPDPDRFIFTDAPAGGSFSTLRPHRSLNTSAEPLRALRAASSLNKYTATWGVMLAGSGVVMNLLLGQLWNVRFYMAIFYLPPAQIVSYGVIVAGALLFAASFFVQWPRYSEMSTEDASKYFGRLALVNALAAAVFVVPFLDPPLAIPYLLTEWPGIYILIAYVFFVIFGVMGMLAWAVTYRFAPSFFSRESVDRRSAILQMIFSEVGIYSVSSLLFLAGFIGSEEVRHGNLAGFFIGATMEFSDIPAAVGIFIILLSVVLGAVTILDGKVVAAPTGKPALVSSGPLPPVTLSVPRKED